MSKKTLRRQSLPDMTIQECGGLESMMEVAAANGLSITDDITPGTELKCNVVSNKKTVEIFTANDIRPATGITNDEVNVLTGSGEGIEFWYVEHDF